MRTDMTLTVRIPYLGSIDKRTGRPATWSPYPTERAHWRSIPDAVTECETSMVASVRCGYADRCRSGQTPGIWGVLTDGRRYEAGPNGVRIGTTDLYAPQDADDAVVAEAVRIHGTVAAAVEADIANRPEAHMLVADWHALLARQDAQYVAHCTSWAADVAAIARAFRRRSVEVGEQTVPGKCVVRGRRGAVLGYAHVWDGRWLGRVSRA